MKHKEIFEHHKQQFVSFVNSLWIGEQLKQHIADEEFMQKNAPAYLYYPVMFYEALESESTTNNSLDLLSIAGYLCFRSVMQNDTELDNHDVISEKFRFPIASRVCQEECVKILASLFPLNSPFWACWNKSKFDFLQAVNLEKQYDGSIVSLEQFERIAEYKSTFAKVAIHAAYYLAGGNNTQSYEDLLESHRLFSVGFQILDDIDDFKKDFVEKQINYAHISLKEVYEAKDWIWDESQIDLLHKQLYVHGVVDKLLILAIEYFSKAQQQVAHLHTPLWDEVLAAKRKEALSVKLRLIAYQKTLYAKVRLSGNKQPQDISLLQAIDEAKNFITTQQEKDGSWVDFYHISGLSDSWATGYILQQISDLAIPYDKDSRQKACNFLLTKRTGGLWGWNTEWVADTDSTTCVLSGLKSNNFDITKELTIWKSFQQDNGGFSTYTNREAVLQSVNYASEYVQGWMQPHVCVSALAFYFLTIHDSHHSQRRSLKNYLLDSQNNNGLWECYWWTSPIYASYYTLKSLAIESNPDDIMIIKKGVQSLLALQQTDGSFTDPYSPSSPFYSAMILDLLSTNQTLYEPYKEETNRLLKWLKSVQFSDGSFTSTASLQIPAPDVVDIKSVLHWERSHHATNHITDDFMRLFSTAQTLKAFDSYYKLTA